MVKFVIGTALISLYGNVAFAFPQSPATATAAGQASPKNAGGLGSLLGLLGGSSSGGKGGAGGAGGIAELIGGLMGGQGGSGNLSGLLSTLAKGLGGSSDFDWSVLLKTYAAGNTANDFVNSKGCKDIIGIFARGSLEPGNLGATTGSYLCTNLRLAYPNRFACQGISSPEYTASVGDNIRPKGTTDEAIAAGIELFNSAHSRCPNSSVIFEGYSQGAALMHNVVEELSPAVRSQIVAGILFGDTKYQQTEGHIPGFEDSKLKIFCHPQDEVCNGRLQVTRYHFEYLRNGDLRKSFEFFTGKVDEVLRSRGQAVSVPVVDEAPVLLPSTSTSPKPVPVVPSSSPKPTPISPRPTPTPAPTAVPTAVPIIQPQPQPQPQPENDSQFEPDTETDSEELAVPRAKGSDDVQSMPFPFFGQGTNDDEEDSPLAIFPDFGQSSSEEDDEAVTLPLPRFGGSGVEEEALRHVPIRFLS